MDYSDNKLLDKLDEIEKEKEEIESYGPTGLWCL